MRKICWKKCRKFLREKFEIFFKKNKEKFQWKLKENFRKEKFNKNEKKNHKKFEENFL